MLVRGVTTKKAEIYVYTMGAHGTLCARRARAVYFRPGVPGHLKSVRIGTVPKTGPSTSKCGDTLLAPPGTHSWLLWGVGDGPVFV